MKNIMIDRVPDDVHAKLKAQAALEKKTFGDYMREKFEELSVTTSIQTIEKK